MDKKKGILTEKHIKYGGNEKEDSSCVMACLGITLKLNEAGVDLTMRNAKLDFGLFVGKMGVISVIA